MTVLLCVLAPAAQAQSSVTLYGVLDSGVSYNNNVAGPAGSKAGSAVRFSNGLLQNDVVVGVKGSEDLGGGWKALYDVESGVDNSTGIGQRARNAGRVAYVGVGG